MSARTAPAPLSTAQLAAELWVPEAWLREQIQQRATYTWLGPEDILAISELARAEGVQQRPA